MHVLTTGSRLRGLWKTVVLERSQQWADNDNDTGLQSILARVYVKQLVCNASSVGSFNTVFRSVLMRPVFFRRHDDMNVRE